MLQRVSPFFVLIGLLLLFINIYGLSQSLRPSGLNEDVLRFKQNDLLLSPDEFLNQVNRLPGEGETEYVIRLTDVIADGMAHVHWGKYDPDRFYQRVPLWENYILYFMGRFSGIPEFERYHFTIAEKGIERGVGLCGDASMLMSEILKKEGIANKIITMPGHVVIAAQADSEEIWLDPDFGVAIEAKLEVLKAEPERLTKAYNNKGFIDNGESLVRNGMEHHNYQTWNGVKHFVQKKYYFERLSYFLKWFIPIFLITIGLYLGRKNGSR
jgi:hypothetical protein